MRRRLNLTVLAVTAMVTLAFLIPLGAVVKVVAADRAMSVANQEARSLSSILASQTPPSALVSVVQELNENGMGRQATVFLPDGKKVGPATSVPAAELAVARRGKAFTTSSNSETRIWVPVRVRSGVIVGLVNVPGPAPRAGVLGAWAVLAGVAVCVLLLALLLSDRLGRSLVLSIKNLESVTRRLSEGQLDARVKPAGPVEIEDMGRAVNRLGERIIELLALEREQAADLSHRLRTPLAALALEADTLNDEGDRQRIRSTVHELTEEVNSVIVQVRQVRPIKVPETCDATATVRERLAFWSVLAEEQRRPWTSDLPDTELAVPLPELRAWRRGGFAHRQRHGAHARPHAVPRHPHRHGDDCGACRRRRGTRIPRGLGRPTRPERRGLHRSRPGHRPPHGRTRQWQREHRLPTRWRCNGSGHPRPR